MGVDSTLVQIQSFESAVFAEIAKARLANSGIEAFIDGANSATYMSYVGTALGGVRLLVRSEDVVAASLIMLSSALETNKEDSPWFCRKCNEEIEAGFSVCWSCGNSRDLVGQEIVPVAIEATPKVVSNPNESAASAPTNPVAIEQAAKSDNPYLSPQARSVVPLVAVIETNAIDERVEEILLRAWRASIIGLLILPLILTAYSFYLLVRASLISNNFTPRGQSRFYQALVLNVVAALFWLAFMFSPFSFFPFGLVGGWIGY